MEMTPQGTSEPSHCLVSADSSEMEESNASNPHPPAPHSNPAVNPQEMGGNRRTPKPPKAPARPLAPFLRFCRKVRDQVKADHPDLKLVEIGKIIGMMWRNLPQAERRKFTEEYESEKVEYEEAMKTYYESPAYRAYSIAMSEASETSVAATGEETHGASALAPSANVDIQPAEDNQDHGDENVSHASRGQNSRNNILLDEVFADAVLSDIRSMDAKQQLSLLKRQMQCLAKHQKMLEADFTKVKEKLETKKMKLAEASSFMESYKMS
ncbi:SWI/SNF-related matrix-associated actin-dependent regulator of chromatin subfamily E member 1-like [Oratosquilla oratoria]|uniref:SWI/SNF-related matrix-associated actin-dependent regulator of chromatin subfamily E member 1-like n=1 Tax=Oratosquilla oratoria TaxID=337810 RepID=UPI003F767BB8